MISKFNTVIFVSIFCTFNITILSVSGQVTDKQIDFDLNNISSEKVRVGDILVSYKMFGHGDPILLIMGYGGTMNVWEPTLLSELSKNHKVVVFDNRGVGGTNGSENFTIDQFAADSAGLLDALKINKSDVLGYSMGGMIAQQLTLNDPEKVDDLIIYASTCGGKLSTLAKPEVFRVLQDKSGTDEDKRKRWIPLQLTEKWIIQYPKYNETFKNITYPPNEILLLQENAMWPWLNSGVCDKLNSISQNTLIITGTGDRVIPPENSLILAEKIPNATLVQIEEGGHKVMSQFPDKFSSDVTTFLES